jgi:hypothetical protein
MLARNFFRRREIRRKLTELNLSNHIYNNIFHIVVTRRRNKECFRIERRIYVEKFNI